MNRVIILFLLISANIYGQLEKPASYKLGFKNGASTSQVSGDTYRGFNKFGYAGGAYLKGRIKNSWTGAIEILYVQSGSRHYSDYNKGDFNSYFLQLNYLEVPLLLQYNYEGACFELGPGCGFLLQTKEIVTLGGADVDANRAFKKNDINLNIGASYTFDSNFGFSLRYTNSILPIRKPLTKGNKMFNYGQLNTFLTLCLTYEFDLRKLLSE